MTTDKSLLLRACHLVCEPYAQGRTIRRGPLYLFDNPTNKKTFPTNPGEASFIPQSPLTSVNPPHFIYKDLKCEKHSLLWSFDTFEQLDFSYHLKTRR